MNATDLEALVRERVQRAAHGERLPPVRSLMREYRVGQAALQEILARMARQGLLTMRVGRGTFVHKGPGGTAARSIRGARVLLLSARVQGERSQRVAQLLHVQLSDRGAHCIQLVYANIEDALEVLRSNLRVDACVLQSYFDLVPLGLLSFLNERCPVLVVDGARVAGLDIDAISSDWRAAMDRAIGRLRDEGHERIGFIAWPGNVQPLDGLRQHFASLRRVLGLDECAMPLVELERMPRAGESSRELVRDALDRLPRGPKRPTGLLLWGPAADVPGLLADLRQSGACVPRDLSLVMLGHVDVQAQHERQIDIIGTRAADAAAKLADQIQRRIEEPRRPGTVEYLPLHEVRFGSVAPAPDRAARPCGVGSVGRTAM